MIYRLFGWWVRWQACKFAAHAMQNHTGEDEICPRAWSLVVFFESYMVYGSEWTREDFGPKDPVELKEIQTCGSN